jgi:hypothetical protein
MINALLIYQSQELGFGNEVTNPHSGRFGIMFFQASEPEHLEVLLRGGHMKEIPSEAYKLGRVYSPDGSPPGRLHSGEAVMTSADQAAEIGRRALANPSSTIVAELGFDADTPIYFVMPNQRAEQM